MFSTLKEALRAGGWLKQKQSLFPQLGFVYVLSNPQWGSNVFKVGKTTRLQSRLNQYNSCNPLSCQLERLICVRNCHISEDAVLRALTKFAVRDGCRTRREFFQVSLDHVTQIILRCTRLDLRLNSDAPVRIGCLATNGDTSIVAADSCSPSDSSSSCSSFSPGWFQPDTIFSWTDLVDTHFVKNQNSTTSSKQNNALSSTSHTSQNSCIPSKTECNIHKKRLPKGIPLTTLVPRGICFDSRLMAWRVQHQCDYARMATKTFTFGKHASSEMILTQLQKACEYQKQNATLPTSTGITDKAGCIQPCPLPSHVLPIEKLPCGVRWDSSSPAFVVSRQRQKRPCTKRFSLRDFPPTKRPRREWSMQEFHQRICSAFQAAETCLDEFDHQLSQ